MNIPVTFVKCAHIYGCAGFEAPTAIDLKSFVCWDITLVRSVESPPTFQMNMAFVSSGSRNKQCLIATCFIQISSLLFFDPEEGGDMFL